MRTFIMIIVILAIVVPLLAHLTMGIGGIESISNSHIRGHVPTAKKFHRYLQRDLDSYFKKKFNSQAKTQYQLLRNMPTQVGVALPKYYLWVEIRFNSDSKKEGAVGIAAFQKSRFEVLYFLSKSEIKSSPDKVSKYFPAVLVGKILQLADGEKFKQ